MSDDFYMLSDEAEAAALRLRECIIEEFVKDGQRKLLEDLCGGWEGDGQKMNGQETITKISEILGGDGNAAHLITHLFALCVERGLVELHFDDSVVPKPRAALNEETAFYFDDGAEYDDDDNKISPTIWDKITFVVK